MNEGFILLIILILIGLIGVTVYLVMDYKKYKTDTDSTLSNQQKLVTSVQQSVSNEGSTRLSNLKFVVDQVNSVNTDIDLEFTSNMSNINVKYASLSNETSQYIRGIDTFFRLNNNNITTPKFGDWNSHPNALNNNASGPILFFYFACVFIFAIYI